MKQCVVCFKRIPHSLFNLNDESDFCTSTCAVWFARAAINSVFLSGPDWQRIENYLKDYAEVIRRRKGRTR